MNKGMSDSEFLRAYPSVTMKELDLFRTWTFHQWHACMFRQNPDWCTEKVFIEALAAAAENLDKPELAHDWIKRTIKGKDIDEALARIVPEKMATWGRREKAKLA